MKVLIIEDERSMALEMAAFLKKAFYLCDLAYTAKQARQMMEENPYNFILIDLGLPDLDGLQVLKEAKNICPDASYIILTARGDLEDRIKGLDLGADDYITKPFSLREVEARIRAINPYAKLHRTQRSQIPLNEILGRNAFDLDRILDIEPEFLNAGDGHDHDHGHDHSHEHGHDHHDHGGLKHYHDEDMQSFSLKTDKALSPDKFFPWIQKLVAEDGPAILRCKGILNFKDDPDRFVFQGVHMILDGDHQRAWKDGEKRDSKLVFIGRNLPEEKIRKGFETVLA
jgi:CheY-like chemotaxis protein